MYLSIPSDASQNLFPDNTISSFTVKLPTEIQFDHENYEVGLVSCIWPHSFHNFEKCIIEVRAGDGVMQTQHFSRIEFYGGYYNDLADLLRDLTRKINHSYFVSVGVPLRPEFECKLRLNHLGLVSFVRTNHAQVNVFHIKLSTELYAKLGFISDSPNDSTITTDRLADRFPDLHAGYSALGVYCSIAQPTRIVGDTLAPLLRLLPINRKHNTNIYYQPTTVEYLPLRYDTFSEVKIEFRTDTGRLVHFHWGKCIIDLHIKRRAFM